MMSLKVLNGVLRLIADEMYKIRAVKKYNIRRYGEDDKEVCFAHHGTQTTATMKYNGTGRLSTAFSLNIYDHNVFYQYTSSKIEVYENVYSITFSAFHNNFSLYIDDNDVRMPKTEEEYFQISTLYDVPDLLNLSQTASILSMMCSRMDHASICVVNVRGVDNSDDLLNMFNEYIRRGKV